MNETSEPKPAAAETPPPPAPTTHVAPSPHVAQATTTRRMMIDVLIGLAPLLVVSVAVFRQYAVFQLALCIASCLLAEVLMTTFRRRPLSITDGSAVVTGAILAFSLPWSAPWYVSVIAGAAAVIIGKMIFGGLGFNIVNPAMLGRAFVMISFAWALGADAYVVRPDAAMHGGAEGVGPTAVKVGIETVTQATPLTAYKNEGVVPGVWTEFVGDHNGSLGETSAVACLIGGLFLCLRRTAAWQIPAGMIGVSAAIAALLQWGGHGMGVVEHLFSGALLFGAFFIATDPTTSPLTSRGRFVFGVGVGALVMLLRTLSNYPEGVMFAVLVMNLLTPLINRWTIPVPMGGPVPERKPAT